MSDTGRPKRQQTRDLESHINTRQDRNTYLTDGGLWSWDQGTGTLAWSAAFSISRGGIVADTVLAGSEAGLTSAGDAVYVDVDRATGGATLTTGTVSMNDSANSIDERIILAIRGNDDKIYLHDGTILSDGESKPLGTINQYTDRNDVVADGNALQNVGFDYALAAGLNQQLTVFVGGVLQTAGVHYNETSASPGQVTFTAGNIPSAGERISFVNVVGGQGPPGSGAGLQDILDNSNDADADISGPLFMHALTFSGPQGSTLIAFGSTNVLANARGTLSNKGFFYAFGHPTTVAERAGIVMRDGSTTDNWFFVPEDTASGDLLLFNDLAGLGLRIDKGGQGLEWGAYTGGSGFPNTGGTWSGDGPIRWTVIEGTLDGSASQEILNTGITSILGVVFSLERGSATEDYIGLESDNTGISSRRYAVVFDAATGDITICNTTNGLGDPGGGGAGAFPGADYKLIVFHQG